MKGVMAVLAMMSLLFIGAAMAAEPAASGLGSTVTLTDLDGNPIQFMQAYFPKAMGQNQMVVIANQTVQVFDPKTRRWHRETKIVYANDKSGDGWGNKLVPAIGGGLASNPGPFFPLIRPAQVTQTNTGGNTGPVTTGPVTTGAVTATGGAGGTGGAATSLNINQTVTNSDPGNSGHHH